ncbi:hypothetical protein ACFPOD_06500 [Nitratireductor kimnyeongensis]|uniref:Uncharacterized protein n=1 Tax=Nitratireductor kimnyeongensis TaxID=430679 RepID=A0ABW0T6Y4_9HYPH|nr:hypothetical protein [Nitratireductor kimnyeongensis]QZZ34293.1 hypothetical protein KW403_10700 [Nitratireductor kimnyeongensis]
MDAIENAIRKAFEKGDASKRPFREKVYRSAFAALERTLEARDDLSEEAKTARRENLKTTITEIETEFVPAAPQARGPQVSKPAPRERPAPSPQVEPEARSAPRAREKSEAFAPQIDPRDRSGVSDDPSPEEAKRRIRAALPRPRRSYAMLFLIATVVAFLGLGLWWTMSSGILMSSDERDTSVRNPPLALEEDNYSADEETTASGSRGSRAEGEWITIFDPTDPTTVSAPDGGNIDVMRNDDQVFLQVSTSGGAGISFDVGRGILETLVGRNAIFSIEARAQDGEETQLSLSCNFGALGDCGRTRYVVGPTRSDYLFEVELPNQSPSSGGTITIVPDATGEGHALDVFSIRAAIATQ